MAGPSTKITILRIVIVLAAIALVLVGRLFWIGYGVGYGTCIARGGTFSFEYPSNYKTDASTQREKSTVAETDWAEGTGRITKFCVQRIEVAAGASPLPKEMALVEPQVRLAIEAIIKGAGGTVTSSTMKTRAYATVQRYAFQAPVDGQTHTLVMEGFFAGGVFFLTYVEGLDADIADDDHSEHFFNSFRMLGVSAAPTPRPVPSPPGTRQAE